MSEISNSPISEIGVDTPIGPLTLRERDGALFAVNDRADIARAASADVLHLGQDDLPLKIAREVIGAGPLIGRSTHDADQVGAAAFENVDYFCVGPCWPTPTKPGRTAPGLDLVRTAAALDTDTLFGRFRINPVTGAQVKHEAALVRWTPGGLALA